MIKLNEVELEEIKNNPDAIAQLLVRKAIEEEIILKPFSDEQQRTLENIKKNVEIEFFLNLNAEDKVTVTDIEILEVYRNNIAALKDKKVEEIFPQLKQSVFNQKLGVEKANIVNELVKKYDLNTILKEHVPELQKIESPTDAKEQNLLENSNNLEEIEKTQSVTTDQAAFNQSVETEESKEPEIIKVADIIKVSEVVEEPEIANSSEKIIEVTEIAKEEIKISPELLTPKPVEEPVVEPIVESLVFEKVEEVEEVEKIEKIEEEKISIEPIFQSVPVEKTTIEELFSDTPVKNESDELFDNPFITSTPTIEKPVIETTTTSNPFVNEPIFVESEAENGPFMNDQFSPNEKIEDIFKSSDNNIPTDNQKEDMNFFEAPKVVFDDSILKTTIKNDNSTEDIKIRKKSDIFEDSEPDSQNMPFSFGNFNFKFD
jgi:hypothetical protein